MPSNLEHSTANFKAALSGHHEHLVADAYDFVKANKTEIAVVAVLVGASAVAFATRGKVITR